MNNLSQKILISLIFIGVFALFYYGYTYESWLVLLWSNFIIVSGVVILFTHLFRMKRLSVFANILLIHMSILFALLLFETSIIIIKEFEKPKLSASWAIDSDYPVGKKDGVSYTQNSDFGVQPTKGLFRAHKLAPDGSSVFNVTYDIGEDRFRKTDQKHYIDNNRINMFGGSFMFGEGVDGTETLPYFFHMLTPSYTVKNYGSHGWGVHQALAILESKLDTSGNINFLLTAPWHAERMRCVKGRSAVNNPVYKLIDSNLVERNGDCRWVESTPSKKPPTKLMRMLNKSEVRRLFLQVFKADSIQDNEIKVYIAMINYMAEISKKRNQQFIVGFIKSSGNYFYGRWTNDKILSKLSELNINVIDMTLAKKNENLADKYVVHSRYERHPSILAHFERSLLLRSYIQSKNVQ